MMSEIWHKLLTWLRPRSAVIDEETKDEVLDDIACRYYCTAVTLLVDHLLGMDPREWPRAVRTSSWTYLEPLEQLLHEAVLREAELQRQQDWVDLFRAEFGTNQERAGHQALMYGYQVVKECFEPITPRDLFQKDPNKIFSFAGQRWDEALVLRFRGVLG